MSRLRPHIVPIAAAAVITLISLSLLGYSGAAENVQKDASWSAADGTQTQDVAAGSTEDEGDSGVSAGSMQINSKAASGIKAGKKALPEDVFTVELEPSSGDYTDQVRAVRWWYSELNNAWCLFIPSGMENALYWNFSAASEILVDGQHFHVGDAFGVGDGTHTLTAVLPQGTQDFQIMVLHSDSVATLFINTDSGSMDYIHAQKGNSESGSYALYDAQGNLQFAGDIRDIHCRGNASFTDYDKKSYKLSLDEKADIFGFGASRSWVLIANAPDTSLLRNRITYHMAEKLKVRYAVQMDYVDLYLNGVYAGNYLLGEKAQISPQRVDVRNLEDLTEEMNEGTYGTGEAFDEEENGIEIRGVNAEHEPADETGGYLFQLDLEDRYEAAPSGFETQNGACFVLKSPEYATKRQISYISALYQEFETALYSENGVNPGTGRYYADYIDTDSFARKYLIEEITKNLDAVYSSQFIVKPDDAVSTKMFAGPAWDYDKALGGSGGSGDLDAYLSEPDGLYAGVDYYDNGRNRLWAKLCAHEDFQREAAQIYLDGFADQIEPETENFAREEGERILSSGLMDAVRWDHFADQESLADKKAGLASRQQEVITFLHERSKWLTEEFSKVSNE